MRPLRATSPSLVLLLTLSPGLRAEARTAATCSAAGFYAGAITVVGSGLFDIFSAPATARRYNRRLALTPAVNPANRSLGLRLSWQLGKSVQPAPSLHRSAPLPAWQQPVPRTRSPKSPELAMALSLFATAVPVAIGLSTEDGWMFLAGEVVGPSVGQMYAQRSDFGLGTAGLRALGSWVGLVSIIGCFD